MRSMLVPLTSGQIRSYTDTSCLIDVAFVALDGSTDIHVFDPLIRSPGSHFHFLEQVFMWASNMGYTPLSVHGDLSDVLQQSPAQYPRVFDLSRLDLHVPNDVPVLNTLDVFRLYLNWIDQVEFTHGRNVLE